MGKVKPVFTWRKVKSGIRYTEPNKSNGSRYRIGQWRNGQVHEGNALSFRPPNVMPPLPKVRYGRLGKTNMFQDLRLNKYVVKARLDRYAC
jgi:hypothetical protein